jgi:RimJ/RimL family protein N-acetyltransferase
VLSYPVEGLTDGVVTLRPWRLSDLPCVEEASRDARIPEGTTVPAQYTVAEGLAYIRRQWTRVDGGRAVSMAIARTGTDTGADADSAVGQLFLTMRPQPGVVGLGYWLVPSARGAGLTSRAVTLATDWALGELGLDRVEAWVEPRNEPSARTLLRAGFQREGRLRSFLLIGSRRADVDVFSRVAVGGDAPT